MSTPNQEPPRTPPAEQPEAAGRPAEQPARRGRRRGCLLTGCGTILGIVVLLLAAGLYFGTRSESYTENVAATINIVEGSAEVKRAGGNWEKVDDMAPLAPGDTVRIGDGSAVFVNYFDGSTTRLNDKSEFVLLKSSRAVNKPGMLSGLFGGGAAELKVDTDISGRLVVGKALTRVQKLGSASSSFEFQTPNSLAGVTGTIIETVVDENGETTWQVAEGSITGMAIVVDDATGEVTGVMMPIGENESVTVQALPPGIDADQLMKLVEAASQIVSKVVKAVREEMEARPDANFDAVWADQVKKADLADTMGKDEAKVVLSLAKALGRPVPSEQARQQLVQQVVKAVVEKKVDASQSITRPGTTISDDWLADWRKPGREIMILKKSEIESKVAEVAKNYVSVGTVTIDFPSGGYIQVAAGTVNATLGYSHPRGRLQIAGIPGWVQPQWYEGYLKNLKKILVIKLEKAGASGHTGPNDTKLAKLDSDQLVVVMENW